ncbi:MAG: hypothetical protein CM15mP83_8370 [Flavobacteriaceae bacterium]|nr:MAG: hypothetical protein CM15mP83_8370 [Flavobacteriaceae bacterium]
MDSFRLALPDSNFSGSLFFQQFRKHFKLVIDELIINPKDILAFMPDLSNQKLIFYNIWEPQK